MTVWQRITREPALILGVVTAGLSLAVLFGVDITAEQIAQGGVFIGALIALLRVISTPSSEVIAQEKPGGQVVAGAAAWVDDGREVEVRVKPTDQAVTGDEMGAAAMATMAGSALAGAVLCVLLVVVLAAAGVIPS